MMADPRLEFELASGLDSGSDCAAESESVVDCAADSVADFPPPRAAMARRAILFYQEYISPSKMGASCRFTPTCSQYALIAYSRFGWLKGTLLTIRRLGRCGPWHPGGWDPVPPHSGRH